MPQAAGTLNDSDEKNMSRSKSKTGDGPRTTNLGGGSVRAYLAKTIEEYIEETTGRSNMSNLAYSYVAKVERIIEQEIEIDFSLSRNRIIALLEAIPKEQMNTIIKKAIEGRGYSIVPNGHGVNSGDGNSRILRAAMASIRH